VVYLLVKLLFFGVKIFEFIFDSYSGKFLLHVFVCWEGAGNFDVGVGWG